MTGWIVAGALYVLGCVSFAVAFSDEGSAPVSWRFAIGVVFWPILSIAALGVVLFERWRK